MKIRKNKILKKPYANALSFELQVLKLRNALIKLSVEFAVNEEPSSPVFDTISVNIQPPNMLDSNGNEDEVFVYFGRSLQLQSEQMHLMERVNFANSKFTLYNQIINTLIFRDILSEYEEVN